MQASELVKILVVDDDTAFQTACKARTSPRFEVLSALNGKEAETLLSRHSDIAVIALDGHLRDGGDTLQLVAKIRAGGFGRILISTTSDWAFAERLVTAGCDFAIRKRYLPLVLGKLLGFSGLL